MAKGFPNGVDAQFWAAKKVPSVLREHFKGPSVDAVINSHDGNLYPRGTGKRVSLYHNNIRNWLDGAFRERSGHATQWDCLMYFAQRHHATSEGYRAVARRYLRKMVRCQSMDRITAWAEMEESESKYDNARIGQKGKS